MSHLGLTVPQLEKRLSPRHDKPVAEGNGTRRGERANCQSTGESGIDLKPCEALVVGLQ